MIVIGDTNLKRRRDSDLAALERLLAEAGLEDVCALVAPEQSQRIDRILFRSSAHLQLMPQSWTLQEDFVDTENRALSDHEAIAVRFTLVHP